MGADVSGLPPGFTLDQPQQESSGLPPGFTLDTQPQAAQQPAPSWRDILKAHLSASPDFQRIEPALNVATGMVATPIAGLAGLVTANPDNVEKVQQALTYEPVSQGGRELTEAVTYPFQKIAQGAEKAGDIVNEMPFIPTPYGVMRGGPEAATIVNTGIQMAPAVLLRGRGAPAAAKPNPAVAAENYVRSIGRDWSRLSDATRTRITEIAQDGTALQNLDAAALRRQIDLEALPVKVPATKGQLTRDPVQLRNEGNIAATEAGKPIRDIHVAQNKALLDNLELLKTKTRGTAVTKEQVGQSVQGAARAKYQLTKEQVSDLYKKAEAAGELEANVSVRPLLKTIAESPDKTHFGWVEQWLNKTEAQTKIGNAPVTKKYKLKELEDLRQAAVARAMDGGTEGYYAGKVIRAIDDATNNAGGAAYKQARAARKAQAMEFEEQAGVNRLVENSSRTDRAIALEDTWRKTVLGGSIDDLRNVKKSLLTGGNSATRTAGKKAWQDMRAQTVQHIYDEATKSVTRFEDGSPNITPASMERAIKSVGPEKMNEIFGPGTVERINKIMEATRTVKTEPPPSFKGSPTFANIISFLEKGIGKLPVIGDTTVGIVKAGAKLKEMGQASREIKTAQQGPLDMKIKPQNKNALSQNRKINALAAGSTTQDK